MRLLGMSLHDFLKTGAAAVLFILLLKWLAPKTGVPAVASTAAAI